MSQPRSVHMLGKIDVSAVGQAEWRSRIKRTLQYLEIADQPCKANPNLDIFIYQKFHSPNTI